MSFVNVFFIFFWRGSRCSAHPKFFVTGQVISFYSLPWMFFLTEIVQRQTESRPVPAREKLDNLSRCLHTDLSFAVVRTHSLDSSGENRTRSLTANFFHLLCTSLSLIHTSSS